MGFSEGLSIFLMVLLFLLGSGVIIVYPSDPAVEVELRS